MTVSLYSVSHNFTKHLCAAPGFPGQTFPNGYPGYPISADSSQPSLTDDHRHSLMGMDDQVRPGHTTLMLYGDVIPLHYIKAGS